MTMLFEDLPLSEGTIRQRFQELSREMSGYMALVDEVLVDEMAIHIGDKICTIRKSNVREDLDKIYSGIGSNNIKRVFELGNDFDKARKGGLEILPMQEVVAVMTKRARAAYKSEVENTGWLNRLIGHLPEV